MENKEIQSQTSRNLLDEITEQRDLANIMSALCLCSISIETECRLCEVCPYNVEKGDCMRSLFASCLDVVKKYFDVKFR